MIIAIPVNGPSLTSSISTSFGRTPYFLIHDAQMESNRFVENEAAASQDGAGVRACQTIVDENVDVLLTPRCGGNAARILQIAEVEIFLTQGDSIVENLKHFTSGQLAKFEKIDGVQGGYGKR